MLINKDLVEIWYGSSVDLAEPYDYRQTSSESLSNVIGEYLIKKGNTLHVTTDGSGLFIQETGQLKYGLFQFGDDRFVMTMQECDDHAKV